MKFSEALLAGLLANVLLLVGFVLYKRMVAKPCGCHSTNHSLNI